MWKREKSFSSFITNSSFASLSERNDRILLSSWFSIASAKAALAMDKVSFLLLLDDADEADDDFEVSILCFETMFFVLIQRIINLMIMFFDEHFSFYLASA